MLFVEKILLVMCLGLLASLPAPKASFAQTFEQNKQQLDELQQNLQQTENARALTQTKLRHLNRDMGELESDIITKGLDIQKIERELAEQDKRLNELAIEEQKKTLELDAHQINASKLVSAAWSLQHRPQLAAWLMPEQNRERALTVRALHVSTLSVKRNIDKIATSMRELEEIRFAMIQTQKDRNQMRQSLSNERASLQSQLGEQGQLQATLRQDDGIYAKKLDGLIRQAEDLQSLVESLEQERNTNPDDFANIQPINKPVIPTITPAIAPQKQLLNSSNFAQIKGRLPLPATGVMVGKFGEQRGANDRLKGIEIKTSVAAIVTAPFEGEVLFTGPFLEYGNMVIIRHSKQYHTLIAGLSQINVQRGQFLLEGALIGAMGDGSKQNLYLELRSNSTAIDPAPWYNLNNNLANR